MTGESLVRRPWWSQQCDWRVTCKTTLVVAIVHVTWMATCKMTLVVAIVHVTWRVPCKTTLVVAAYVYDLEGLILVVV